jgi:hypothetical protein
MELRKERKIMNQTLSKFARNFLKNNIKSCSEKQVELFKRMYSPDNLEADIDSVVDNIPDEKLDWAIQQVERIQKKNLQK